MPDDPKLKYVPALRFHFLTPLYDVVVGATTREGTFKTNLVTQACIQPEQRVLDLACGTGTLAIWLKQSCPEAEIVCVDGDDSILSIAVPPIRFAAQGNVAGRATRQMRQHEVRSLEKIRKV